jgi:hypothetical protein
MRRRGGVALAAAGAIGELFDYDAVGTPIHATHPGMHKPMPRPLRHCRPIVFALLTIVFPQIALTAERDGLIAHWPFGADASDHGPRRFAATNHGAVALAPGPADRAGTATAFDGRDDWIEVKTSGPLRLGAGDFSVATWVHTAAELDDVLGDIVACYDPAARRGFTFGLVHNPGVATNQSNSRNVHFGIDNGREPTFTDCGRPGNAVLAFAFAVFEGRLYAGTCEGGSDQSGHVYLYEGEDRWTDCGSPDPCNAVTSLIVHQGKLFAGVSKYRLAGSAQPESENPHLGGKIYRYEGGMSWTPCGELPGREAIGGMVVYRGQLYASSLYKPAGFFRYEGGASWTELPVPDGMRVEHLAMHDGQIYASCYDQAHVYRFDGSAWTDCGQVGPAENTQTYCFAVHSGRLFNGTWRTGRVFRYESDDNWTDVGRLDEEWEVMGMASFNGQLYAGSLPLAAVFRWDGESTWTNLERLDLTPDQKYRRVWTMAEYQGRLYCSSLPNGRVHALEAGKSVSYDRELPAGWIHLAAVRAGDRLHLYVGGELAASSTSFDPGDYDLSIDRPWQIGFGPHAHLNGRLSDLRVYGRALDAAEVRALSAR